MRLIKVTGGLGNQMFIYAFYYHMQKIHPNTCLDLSDMKHYHVHHGYELHKVFAHLPANEICINRVVKKVMEFLFFRTILERKQPYGAVEVFMRKRFWPLVYFKGFYQSELFFAPVAGEIRRLFAFDASKANARSRELAARLAADPRSVSLHVRRGDYATAKHWENLGSVCGLAYYRNALEELGRRVPGAAFYVFSDDVPWAKENLPLPEAVYVDWNKGEDSWQDMWLMSLCRNHVICNSSFSWWGAWLDPHADKVVVAPERWFRNGEAPSICPESWIKVPIN